MNAAQLADQLSRDSAFGAQVSAWKVQPRREPQYAEWPCRITHRLQEALATHGVDRPYTHQAEAITRIFNGEDVCIVTGTASGKTLCYNAPVIQTILDDPTACAIYLFPTKALAQDQLSELRALVQTAKVDIKTFTYDGDTAPAARRAVRRAGHIVFTNPDMLHQGILPHHTSWTRLFENLTHVIVDELHVYRGIFGSHLGNVFRRLQRIAEFYGSKPQFVCCSATIANPKELGDRLTDRNLTVIDNDGSPAGEKHIVLYNPPVVNQQLGLRASAQDATVSLARRILSNNIQTLVFARSRTETELLLSKIRGQPNVGQIEIRGYRGGYLPAERRAIEAGLRDGSVRGVVSTNALELGVDIGQLQAVLISGYPGTLASLWQQLGRAGRRQESSIAVFIAGSNPLDQFIVHNPEFLFESPVESGLINPKNPYVYTSHLKCAAFELPFAEGEEFVISNTDRALSDLESVGVIHKAAGTYYWSSEDYPAQFVSLRTGALENVVIVDETKNPRVIGHIDQFSAPTHVHPDAIYLHGGRQFHVDRLDWHEAKAFVHEVAVEHYTVANMDVKIAVLDDFEAIASHPLGRSWGDVRVTAVPTIYKKLRLSDNDNVGWGTIDLPQQELHTQACWIWLDEGLTSELKRDEITIALQGLAQLLPTVASLYLMCDPRDLGVSSEIKSPFTEAPTVYIYDRFPGGVGLAERLYSIYPQILDSAMALVTDCACLDGCPSCVGPPVAPGVRAKAHTLTLLQLGTRVPVVAA